METSDPCIADGLDFEPSCRHHWMIEAPSGPTSRGTCRKCGEEKEFRNSLADPPRDDDAFSHFFGRDNFAQRFRSWDGDRESSFSSDGYE